MAARLTLVCRPWTTAHRPPPTARRYAWASGVASQSEEVRRRPLDRRAHAGGVRRVVGDDLPAGERRVQLLQRGPAGQGRRRTPPWLESEHQQGGTWTADRSELVDVGRPLLWLQPVEAADVEQQGEVEVAADIATRASDQAADAVKVSETLADTAKSIESILGLIRDVAGQTNLLALNATIEAARAGDAGRGFAVVAQEVKSLASQTARATDDINAKITAIQQATRQTVEANGSIQSTVLEVQTSADRIRQAMELQAQTVTMITAAVDETALAADSKDIDQVEQGFGRFSDQIGDFRTATNEFVSSFAA